MLTKVDPHAEAAALFLAAFLTSSPKLPHPAWARIITAARPFDIHSPKEAAEGLAEAFHVSGTGASLSGISNGRLAAVSSLADAWLGQGVGIVTKEDMAVREDLGEDFPPILFSRGDRSLLDRPAATVLNSRKPKTVTSSDPWLLRTVSFARYARGRGLSLISSYGSVTYGLLTFLGKGAPLIAVCPDALPFMESPNVRRRFFQDNAGLFLTRKTLFLSSFLPGLQLSRPSRFAERDRLVGALAAVLLVAEVKTGGNMGHVLQRARQANKPIIGEETSAEGRKSGVLGIKPVSYSLRRTYLRTGPLNPTPHLSRSGCPEGDTGSVGMLVHYTRACPGPWPGQTPAAYFRSLVNGASDSSHTAFDALRRILREQLIRGSTRLTRGRTPVVSFTERLPDELADLAQWRTGLIRTWFEPYGIGISKASLLASGVDRVVYGDDRVYRDLPEERKHLFQLWKPSGKDWSLEREWRLKGSFHLSGIPGKDFIVIVQTRIEADIIQRDFAVPVISSGLE